MDARPRCCWLLTEAAMLTESLEWSLLLQQRCPLLPPLLMHTALPAPRKSPHQEKLQAFRTEEAAAC